VIKLIIAIKKPAEAGVLAFCTCRQTTAYCGVVVVLTLETMFCLIIEKNYTTHMFCVVCM